MPHNDCSELPVTVQPLNFTLTDIDIATVCSIDNNQWYGLPFCTSAPGDCNVKFIVNTSYSSQNGMAVFHLMPG